MSRLLMLLAIGAAIYVLVRSYRKGSAPPDNAALRNPAEDMVQCSHCGVHLPKGESILVLGDYYCSAAHRDAHEN